MKNDEFEPLAGVDARVNLINGLLILAALVIGSAVARLIA